ncbi:MAG: WecB/TagA/CpsF family glycosyltransferase [Phascolarctobacterium sp.]|nr:WecB/TagA/CpsF family glycosyltransferase [Phascolarctobacterium sp.]
MAERMQILGVPVDPMTMQEAVAKITTRTLEGKQTFVVTANAEIIMMCQENPAYKEIVSNKADIVLADGAGAVWAGRYKGYEVPERVAGYDLYRNLLDQGRQHEMKSFFFGGSPAIAETAKTKVEELYPGVKVVGTHNGYFKDEDVPDIIDEINQSGADYLFIALGAPKQENWIMAHKDELKCKLFMGIGGSFDVLAGKMERAPKWMQDASLEWLFRLYKQPSRFMRMMALPKFVLKVIFSK